MTKTIVYEPDERMKMGLLRSLRIMYGNMTNNWELNYQLFKRDFLQQYKKSLLGMAWLFITPIIGIISWVFMNATGVLKPGDVGIPYPAYILIGTTVFGLFQSFFTGASGTLSAGAGFISQVNYPHDSLLVKQTLQQLASFAINFTITMVILLFFKVYPSWLILLFPLLIIPLFLLGSAIGLVSSILTVVAPDVQRLLGFFMGLLLFITPIIYSSNIDNPILQKVIKWNPLTYIVGGVRDAIIYGRIEHFDRYLIVTGISFILFFMAWRFFYISEQKVIEKMI
ncbi:MAG: ABC transporter permease [Ferruginibacter sp.]